MSEWISIKDELPNEDEVVLLYPTWQAIKYSTGYWIQRQDGSRGWFVGGTYGGSIEKGITHWQRIEPPESKDE